jgi:hypothetical protein
LTFSGVLVIGNHTLLFQKFIKIKKEKLSDLKKKNLLGNSNAKITKKICLKVFQKK